VEHAVAGETSLGLRLLDVLAVGGLERGQTRLNADQLFGVHQIGLLRSLREELVAPSDVDDDALQVRLEQRDRGVVPARQVVVAGQP
jgi:hypothetical protein